MQRDLLDEPPGDEKESARSIPAAVEASGGLEQGAVVGGDALVLAEVLEPGLDDEHLEPAVRVLGVTVDVPADGAVAAAGPLAPPPGAAGPPRLRGVHPGPARAPHPGPLPPER